MHPAPNAPKYPQKSPTPSLAGGLALILLGLVVNEARAIAPIGSDGAIFGTGVVSTAYNDNIFLSDHNAKSSEVTDLIPGVSYEYGQNGALDKGAAQFYEDFQLFSSNSNLNNQLANFVFWNKYEDASTKLNFDANFHQLDQADRDVHQNGFLVDRDTYHLDGTGEQRIDEKSSVAAGIIFDDTDYKAPGYVDIQTTTIPVNYYLSVEPKLDFSTGVRYRINSLQNGDDSTDIYANVGFRGEFTPSLTGELDVGYNHQSIDVGRGTSGLGADASLIYAYSPKTNIIAGLTDDFGYGADGSPFRQISGNIGITSSIIDEQWTVDLGASYGRYSYLNRDQVDNFYTAQAGVTYIYSLNLKFRAGYTFYQDQSSVSNSSFTNNIFSLTASVSF
jgi:hypothetical protein